MALGYLAAQHPDPDHLLSVQVRRAHAGSLGFSAAVPSLSSTARLLGLHPRTLQRRLADEGATHEAILDGVRREAARRWILTTDLPLIQISHLLGFSEQSSLTHAATRWFGVTPRQLRRQRPTDSGVVAREQVRSADRRDP
jgi:AraC-like DNA-binding protein